jgi:hypothetical protein
MRLLAHHYPDTSRKPEPARSTSEGYVDPGSATGALSLALAPSGLEEALARRGVRSPGLAPWAILYSPFRGA